MITHSFSNCLPIINLFVHCFPRNSSWIQLLAIRNCFNNQVQVTILLECNYLHMGINLSMFITINLYVIDEYKIYVTLIRLNTNNQKVKRYLAVQLTPLLNKCNIISQPPSYTHLIFVSIKSKFTLRTGLRCNVPWNVCWHARREVAVTDGFYATLLSRRPEAKPMVARNEAFLGTLYWWAAPTPARTVCDTIEEIYHGSLIKDILIDV